ncbi:MAG: DUF779 domain-containing protein [Pyrinomonadaceae bacterium]|nr:DUF779 domain-containing protein [Pyrinomonadaceae bacterium]
MSLERIAITDEAAQLVRKLQAENGALIFHQSGGCCDGSSPMCYPKGEFRIGGSDVQLGTIENCDFFMSESQFEFWKHTHLTVDVVKGRGSGFSLEAPEGVRFLIRSRILTPEEEKALTKIQVGS